VCTDIGIEPTLKPLDNEPLHYATANSEDGPQLNVVAWDFWDPNRQRVFFDIWVFNLFASCYLQSPLLWCYVTNEQQKRRAYDERVREVEIPCFSPLVFSAAWVHLLPVCKKLASMLADKWGMNYSQYLFRLRCRVCFSGLSLCV